MYIYYYHFLICSFLTGARNRPFPCSINTEKLTAKHLNVAIYVNQNLCTHHNIYSGTCIHRVPASIDVSTVIDLDVSLVFTKPCFMALCLNLVRILYIKNSKSGVRAYTSHSTESICTTCSFFSRHNPKQNERKGPSLIYHWRVHRLKLNTAISTNHSSQSNHVICVN